jgi:hypothetical protein
MVGYGELVRGTLLSGQVFDSKDYPGRHWVIRWTEATLPNGDKHPVCIEGSFEHTQCPNGGARICPKIQGYAQKQWDHPIIP